MYFILGILGILRILLKPRPSSRRGDIKVCQDGGERSGPGLFVGRNSTLQKRSDSLGQSACGIFATGHRTQAEARKNRNAASKKGASAAHRLAQPHDGSSRSRSAPALDGQNAREAYGQMYGWRDQEQRRVAGEIKWRGRDSEMGHSVRAAERRWPALRDSIQSKRSH